VTGSPIADVPYSMASTNRLRALRAELQARKLDAMLVAFAPNVRFVTTGFTGSSGLAVITPTQAVLYSDFRYKEQAKAQAAAGWKVSIPPVSNLLEAAVSEGVVAKCRKIGFESEFVTVATFEQMKKTLGTKRALVAAPAFVEPHSMVKDEWEVTNIKKAAAISAKVFHELLPMLKPGVREKDISAEITYRHLRYGADGDAFDSIVASGPRSSMPHGKASDRKIKKNEFVTIDFGCKVAGYHCDITRTVAVGKVSAEEKRIYGIVYDAQQLAMDTAKAGMNGKQLDAVARDLIGAHGYVALFGHSLGHGLGLQIHENPRIATVGERFVLKPNMVITIEPGVYFPGKFGVRIEDDVRITRTGCDLLTPQITRTLITL
jgi:Xaa-Pro aminopeptidase